MKQNLPSLIVAALIVAIGALATGCITPGSPTEAQQLAFWQSKAKIIAYGASSIYLTLHPGERPKFVQAKTELELMQQTQSFDPAMLASVISRNLPMSELKSKEAAIIVTAGLMIYQDAIGSTTIEQPKIVEAFVAGFIEGLNITFAAFPAPLPEGVSSFTNAEGRVFIEVK